MVKYSKRLGEALAILHHLSFISGLLLFENYNCLPTISQDSELPPGLSLNPVHPIFTGLHDYNRGALNSCLPQGICPGNKGHTKKPNMPH